MTTTSKKELKAAAGILIATVTALFLISAAASIGSASDDGSAKGFGLISAPQILGDDVRAKLSS